MKNFTPLISVIIRTYNTGDSVTETINVTDG
jgi:glycosyltransferase involved in cell wall biosynthesis